MTTQDFQERSRLARERASVIRENRVIKFAYVPCYIDHYQSARYCHVGYTVRADGRLLAHFADGGVYESVYPTVSALLAAGERDHLERVRVPK